MQKGKLTLSIFIGKINKGKHKNKYIRVCYGMTGIKYLWFVKDKKRATKFFIKIPKTITSNQAKGAVPLKDFDISYYLFSRKININKDISVIMVDNVEIILSKLEYLNAIAIYDINKLNKSKFFKIEEITP